MRATTATREEGQSDELSGRAGAVKRRYVALDVFRGLTILLMLIVNNLALGSRTPPTLLHAEWTGNVHVADLVFPWFLLAMGVACGLSSGPASFGRISLRVGALLAIGMVVDSAVRQQLTLGLGVLQLIGLAYGVAALSMRLPVWARVVVAAVGLAAHSVLILFYAAPGGVGNVTPEGNAISYLNGLLAPYGLRGMYSVLTTGALAILGSIGGLALRSGRLGRLALIGAAMAALGLSVQLAIPMLKPIWTASYVLYVGGTGVMLIAALASVERYKPVEALTWPLRVFGMNAMVAYVGPILVKVMILRVWTVPGSSSLTLADAAQQGFVAAYGESRGPVLYLAIMIGAWFGVCAILYRRHVFVRV